MPKKNKPVQHPCFKKNAYYDRREVLASYQRENKGEVYEGEDRQTEFTDRAVVGAVDNIRLPPEREDPLWKLVCYCPNRVKHAACIVCGLNKERLLVKATRERRTSYSQPMIVVNSCADMFHKECFFAWMLERRPFFGPVWQCKDCKTVDSSFHSKIESANVILEKSIDRVVDRDAWLAQHNDVTWRVNETEQRGN